VYPALAVLQALLKRDEDREGFQVQSRAAIHIFWVGGQGGMEAELVKREGLPFEAISAAGVHGVGLQRLPGNIWQLSRGFFQARRLLRQFRPDVMFFTGGFVAVPVALAGRLPGRGFPRPRSLLYVPDIEPGLALNTLARITDRVAVTVEASRATLSRHPDVVVTGYPVRSELSVWDKAEARRVFQLTPELPTLLASGGSKGARSINRALLQALPELLKEMQVIHITGNLDWPEVESVRIKMSAELPAEHVQRYHAYPYLHKEMGAALTVADIVISRAGASTLGEYPAFGIPAVLVPYPHAWRYQQINAQYLAERGAAIIIQDADLPGELLPTLRRLMQDSDHLTKMASAMRSLAQPHAAELISDQLFDLVEGRRR